MGYVDSNLLRGESVEYRASLHWMVFKWPALWIAVALVFFVYFELIAVSYLAIIFAVITFIPAFITYKTSEFAITNKRVIAKLGFIKRQSIEIRLSQIEGIHVNQDVLGRLLSYGSIIVTGTGGLKDPIHKIYNPMEFRRRVQELLP